MFGFLVYASFLFFSAAYCIVALIPWLLSLLLPPAQRGKVTRYLVLGFGLVAIRFAMRPFFRVRYENCSEGTGAPMIYVFNHRSGSDPFLVAALGKEIIQFVNGWPMRLPFFGYFAKLGGYVDVTKTSYNQKAELSGRAVRAGASIVAFPEGHRSCSRKMGPFHSGIFRIAMDMGLAVCPCVIAGNEDIPDARFRFHRRGDILIRSLRPIPAEQVKSFPSAFALKRQVRTIIETEAARMDKELDEGKV